MEENEAVDKKAAMRSVISDVDVERILATGFSFVVLLGVLPCVEIVSPLFNFCMVLFVSVELDCPLHVETRLKIYKKNSSGKFLCVTSTD